MIRGCNMANYTKTAIKNTFLELLDKKPYSQITVKDIVEECGINRNSFYYHFADLPALVEEILNEDLERLIPENASFDSLEESFGRAISFAMENRRAIYHLYDSLHRDVLERYLMNSCEKVVKVYVEKSPVYSHFSDADVALIVKHFKYVCFGATIDWMESRMKNDIESDLHRICEILTYLTEHRMNPEF